MLSVASQNFNKIVVERRDLEDHPFAFLKSVEFEAGVAREGGFQSR